MFRKKEKCPICGEKLDKKYHTTLSDGNICYSCSRLSNKSAFASLDQVKRAWEENHNRFQNFKENMVYTYPLGGYLFVDTEHRWAFLSHTKKPKTEPVIFNFSEVEEYRIEQVGQKTITKTKGEIGRAVVGGAIFGVVGAVVGASTAKTETKQVSGIPIIYVELNLNGLKTTVQLSNPPVEARKILDSMIDEG